MDTAEKLSILAEAARYDASCSSSGSGRANSPGGVGNALPSGVCHSFAADGRCISLLKVLLSNACAWDCAYCINRRSNDVPRATFRCDELARLVIDFYRRNYIEGAFISSAVLKDPDNTMDRLIAVARTLRESWRFNGYIHLKAIPGASPAALLEAARWADRVSVNVELPGAESLAHIAPDKSPGAIFNPMRTLARASGFEPLRLAAPRFQTPLLTEPRGAVPAGVPGSVAPAGQQETTHIEPQPCDTGPSATPDTRLPQSPVAPGRELRSIHEVRKERLRNPGRSLLPAGQTTQLIVGASPEDDRRILGLAQDLYLAYDVRRVYYSAYIPLVDDPRLPTVARPPLLREHRLYQADWLFRFYGFRAEEIVSDERPFLEEDLDPKSAWALRNLAFFPVEVNRASYEELLRVPGIGPVSARRILRARRSATLDAAALKALGVVLKRARFFLLCDGKLAWRELESPWAPIPAMDERLSRFLGDGARRLIEPDQLEFGFGAESALLPNSGRQRLPADSPHKALAMEKEDPAEAPSKAKQLVEAAS